MNFRLRGNDVTFERAAGDEEARTALKIVVPKAPWSAVAAATAFGSGSTAAASLPHSMALRAFLSAVESPKAHEISARNEIPERK